MFSITRFDASNHASNLEGKPNSSSSSFSFPDQSKLDALNERIAKRRRLSQPVSTNAPSDQSAQVAASVGLKIHPSRLNAAPALRQSLNRAQNGPKEKTKAKARYLKAKKQRRKAKKKAHPKTKPQQSQTGAADDHHESISSSSSSGSDSHSDSDSDSEASGSESSSSSSRSSKEKDEQDFTSSTASAQPEPTENQEQERSIDGLPAFPSAGRKKKSDPSLIRKLGLPEGMTNRILVDPTLSKPLADADKLVPSASSFSNVKLSQSVRQRLEALGISSWFAVQLSVIPSLLSLPHSRSLYRPYDPPRDLCVSAPTGSGKTLAYSVPIVEVLRTRQITRLRALIVLPTRDLVSQVRSTIELIAKGSGLCIATATGHHSFSHEQNQIMGSGGSQPQIDILIATPGRLIDHLDTTPGFTLAHLRFLVIDEADRLLSQSFHEWLRKVLHATESRSHSVPATSTEDEAKAPFQVFAEPTNPATEILEVATPAVQKLLFSATLTRDPAKISALGLRNPHYISIQDKTRFDGSTAEEHQTYSLPHTLREHMLITTSQEKPLRLLELVHRAKDPVRKALVFTKSIDSAARLVKLIEFYGQVRPGAKLVVHNYSSELRAIDRQRILAQFGRGEIDLLVCSDLISRGIDLSNVQHVVSYDVPVDVAKYIHRVGRTARAGKEGDAWTLVEEHEARHFKRMMRAVIRQAKIDKVKVRDEGEKDPYYPQALAKLAQVYSTFGGES